MVIETRVLYWTARVFSLPVHSLFEKGGQRAVGHGVTLGMVRMLLCMGMKRRRVFESRPGGAVRRRRKRLGRPFFGK